MTQNTIAFADLPAVGSELLGGLLAGVTLTLSPAAVILLPNKPDKRLSRTEALAWAASVGGELPSLPAGAQVFANLKDQLEGDWHWMAEAHAAPYAWTQHMGSGIQSWADDSNEFCVRAVKTIPIV